MSSQAPTSHPRTRDTLPASAIRATAPEPGHDAYPVDVFVEGEVHRRIVTVNLGASAITVARTDGEPEGDPAIRTASIEAAVVDVHRYARRLARALHRLGVDPDEGNGRCARLPPDSSPGRPR